MDSRTFSLPNAADLTDWEILESDLRQISGVSQVEVNRTTHLITIEWEHPASWQTIERHLRRLGYMPDVDSTEGNTTP